MGAGLSLLVTIATESAVDEAVVVSFYADGGHWLRLDATCYVPIE